jgi:hypothetical protein
VIIGQYVDGHERADVVRYRNNVFLPAIARFEVHARNYKNGVEEPDTRPEPLRGRRTVIWYHDESTFYANDRRQLRWVWTKESPKPLPKGEGASIMVADFVSADYGWLRSPDGTASARVLFKAGRNRDGYFSNEEILSHATTAMDILTRYYPDDDHVLVFDNAPTHTKRPDDALSALKMSAKPTDPSHPMFGVDTNVIGANGKPVYGPDGKLLKRRMPMADTTFSGAPQALYFTPEDGTGRKMVFKGMKRILAERGISTAGLKAQCKEFKCIDSTASCCTRRILWNQPDFVNIKSCLEEHCEARGFNVLFLPKFHCELNFIEQCWGAAKRTYRLNPASSAAADLEKNMIEALDSVDLMSMRRSVLFALCSRACAQFSQIRHAFASLHGCLSQGSRW